MTTGRNERVDRERVLDAVAEVLKRGRGKGLTAKAIAKEAGYAEGSVHRCLGSPNFRNAAIDALIERQVARIDAVECGDPQMLDGMQRMRELVCGLVAIFWTDPPLAQLLFAEETWRYGHAAGPLRRALHRKLQAIWNVNPIPRSDMTPEPFLLEPLILNLAIESAHGSAADQNDAAGHVFAAARAYIEAGRSGRRYRLR